MFDNSRVIVKRGEIFENRTMVIIYRRELDPRQRERKYFPTNASLLRLERVLESEPASFHWNILRQHEISMCFRWKENYPNLNKVEF